MLTKAIPINIKRIRITDISVSMSLLYVKERRRKTGKDKTKPEKKAVGAIVKNIDTASRGDLLPFATTNPKKMAGSVMVTIHSQAG